MNIAEIEKAKADLDAGKNLKQIIDDNNFDIKPIALNKYLINRYGTANIGNPLRALGIEWQADKVLEKALLELPRQKVIDKLEAILAKAKGQ